MRSILRRWTMLGVSGAALGGAFAACGGLDSPKIVITDGLGGLGGSSGSGGLDGLGGLGGEKPVLGDPPSVVGVVPEADADDVEPSAQVVIEFSEPLDESSITEDSVYVLDGDIKVPGTLAYANGHVIFSPSSPLALLARYTVHVTRDVRDTTDQALTSEFSSSFVTRDGAWKSEALFREQNTWLRPSKPDARGNVMIAWEEANGNNGGDIYVALVAPNGEVGEKKLIEELDTNCYSPQISMNPAGDAVVAWVNSPGNDEPMQIFARRYIDGEWEAEATRVEGVFDVNNKFADGPFVGASNGVFTVGWIVTSGVYSYLQFTKATGAGAWDVNPFEVDWASTAQGNRVRTNGVSLDFGPDGGGTLVYTYDTTATPRTLRSAFFSTSTNSWSSGAVLRATEDLAARDNCGGCLPVVTRSASGTALVTWSNSDEGSSEINLLASYYTKANGWSAPTVVDKTTGNVFVYRGSVASFGNRFAVAWKQNNQTIFSPLISIYDVEAGTWSEPKLLSDGETNNWYGNPQVATDAHGNLLAAWPQGGDLDLPPTVHFARFNHLDGTWGAPASLVQIDQAYNDVQLVGLGNGPVYALLNQAWNNGYENGPDYPYLAVFE